MSLKKSKIIIVICSLMNWMNISAQDIFPGETGETLVQMLQDAYTPASVLSSSQSKDTLYGVINNNGGTVTCVYSGHSLQLPDGVDPSQWVFMNGETQGINQEHAWPVGKGATSGTKANSDMHHLFPTRVKVNTDRGSFPFGEIPDPQTQRWYYLTNVTGSIPNMDIDLYSEWNNAVFEPREDFKGNVARACFYFYTIYRNQAVAADPDFFELQRETFLQWHMDDPVDQDEIDRTERVALYQDDKPNPFVLDPTLAIRAYCQEGEACMTTSSHDLIQDKGLSAIVINKTLIIEFDEPHLNDVVVKCYSLNGGLMRIQEFQRPENQLEFSMQSASDGIYVVVVQGENLNWSQLIKF